MLDMVKNNLNFLFSKYLQIIGLELKLKKKKTSLYILEKKPCMWIKGGERNEEEK